MAPKEDETHEHLDVSGKGRREKRTVERKGKGFRWDPARNEPSDDKRAIDAENARKGHKKHGGLPRFVQLQHTHGNVEQEEDAEHELEKGAHVRGGSAVG